MEAGYGYVVCSFLASYGRQATKTNKRENENFKGLKIPFCRLFVLATSGSQGNKQTRKQTNYHAKSKFYCRGYFVVLAGSEK